MTAATKYRVSSTALAGLCAIADRHIAVSITGLTSQGCEVHCEGADRGSWDHGADFCRLTIADQLKINGRVVASRESSAQIAFFGHIHPVAVSKLQRLAR